MIPYFTNPLEHLLPSPLNDSWGVLVCIGFVAGLEIARAKAIKEGLDVRDVIDGILAIVGSGFIVGHLVHVLAYHPEQLDQKGPIVLVQVWAGLSSFGGFAGALLGSVLFYKVIRKRPWLQHAEMILFGFPFGWFFGRLGCFTAHDHVGRLTDFPLAVQFPGGARHDLGLYEALWTGVIAVVFLLAARKQRPVGWYAAAWCLMYAPVRFGLDFLRRTECLGRGYKVVACPSAEQLASTDPQVQSEIASIALSDTRWAGLTPAQWGCLVMVGLGVWAAVHVRRQLAAGWAPTPRTPADTSSGSPAPGERTDASP